MATKQILDAFIEDWHVAITSQDIDALMALYTDDAIIESSAVLVLEKDPSGVLRGKEALRQHFLSFFAIVGSSDKDWFRFTPHTVTDSLVMWEYPSRGPEGDQLDVVESFDLDDDGLITRHRVYWGFRGFRLLQDQI